MCSPVFLQFWWWFQHPVILQLWIIQTPKDYDMTFTVEVVGCRDDYALSRASSWCLHWHLITPVKCSPLSKLRSGHPTGRGPPACSLKFAWPIPTMRCGHDQQAQGISWCACGNQLETQGAPNGVPYCRVFKYLLGYKMMICKPTFFVDQYVEEEHIWPTLYFFLHEWLSKWTLRWMEMAHQKTDPFSRGKAVG